MIIKIVMPFQLHFDFQKSKTWPEAYNFSWLTNKCSLYQTHTILGEAYLYKKMAMPKYFTTLKILNLTVLIFWSNDELIKLNYQFYYDEMMFYKVNMFIKTFEVVDFGYPQIELNRSYLININCRVFWVNFNEHFPN